MAKAIGAEKFLAQQNGAFKKHPRQSNPNDGRKNGVGNHPVAPRGRDLKDSGLRCVVGPVGPVAIAQVKQIIE